MNNKEKKFLDYTNERVYFCLQQGMDKGYIAACIDDVMYNLPDDTSSEVFNELYRIADNLLLGGIDYEI